LGFIMNGVILRVISGERVVRRAVGAFPPWMQFCTDPIPRAAAPVAYLQPRPNPEGRGLPSLAKSRQVNHAGVPREPPPEPGDKRVHDVLKKYGAKPFQNLQEGADRGRDPNGRDEVEPSIAIGPQRKRLGRMT
jgi:hypothetical protein